MLLLDITNLKFFFGEKIILDIPNLKIYTGDKIGVVGTNGSGKSTLLNLISGDLSYDEGRIQVNATLTYHKQFYTNQLCSNTITPEEIKKTKQFQSNSNSTSFYSGGEKNRLQLAKTFSTQSDLYLIDEPTSNLDYSGIELLKTELLRLDSFLLVSHDRTLLNECCNKIIELSDSQLTLYEGNYNAYEIQKNAAYNRDLFEYSEYVKEKKRLLSVYQDKLIKAKKVAKKPTDPGQRVGKECGSKSYASKAKNMEKSAQAALKRLDMLEKKEKPHEPVNVKIDFRLTNPPRNKYILEINDLTFSYDSNILFEQLSMQFKNGEKIAILGNNGTGKTTLLNLIATGHSTIKIVPTAKIGYFRQEFEQLDLSKTILENAMYDSIQNTQVVRTMLARLLFDEKSLSKKVSVLSGGERVRLALAKLIVSDANILILDEPTNYLDLASREIIEKVLQEYMGTIIFVSHDKTFVDAIATQKFIISNKKLVEIE